MAVGGETACCLDSPDGKVMSSINGISRAITFIKKFGEGGTVKDPVLY
jgi:hypothetical protein